MVKCTVLDTQCDYLGIKMCSLELKLSQNVAQNVLKLCPFDAS